MPLGTSGHLPEYEYVWLVVGMADVVLFVSSAVVDVKGALVVVMGVSVTFSTLSVTRCLFNNKTKRVDNEWLVPWLQVK